MKAKPSLCQIGSIIGTVVLLWFGSGSVLAAATKTNVKPAFAIICFPGPPSSDNRVEHYRTIRRANFNIVLPSHRYDDEQQLKMLDHCRAAGLRGVVNVKRLAPPVAEGAPPANWPELVQSAVDRFGKHPALYGYMIRDEPNATVFSQLGRVADEFRRVGPAHDICINLFPIYAKKEQLGTPDYEAYLEKFLRTVKPPALCYDHYPFMRNGQDRQDFFLNLEIARRACLKHETPLWIVVLSNWWEHFRTPTDAELRWQAYGALTYGIRGIGYFAYWPVKDNYVSAVDSRGIPQEQYDSLRRLNQELSVLGTRMASLRSVGVYHTGEEIPTGCRRLPDDTWLEAPENTPLAIGLFEGRSGSRQALVMNRDCTEAKKVTLRFPSQVTAVLQVDSKTGRTKKLKFRNAACQVTLPAGTGVLLSLRDCLKIRRVAVPGHSNGPG